MQWDIRPTAEFPRHSEGDTVSLVDGDVLLAWTRFRGREDHARAEIVAMVGSRSEGGNSHGLVWQWSQSRVLVSAAEAAQNVMSVSLLREAGSGDLLLFYLRKNSPSDCRVYVRRSMNEGHTWVEAEGVCQTMGYHVLNNARVVQLASGRLVAPVAFTPDYDRSRHQTAFCYLSDDQGASWRPSQGWVDLPQSAVGCQEPGVVPLERNLLMILRTDLGCVYGALSSDGGDSWGAPWAMAQLPAPMAPATAVRLRDGGLVITYNHRPEGAKAGWADRTPLALARSEDEGRTWRRLTDLESDPAYSYGYTSLRLVAEVAWLSYYVWPRHAPEHFLDTALRVRTIDLAALG